LNIIVANIEHWTVLNALRIKQHLLTVYIITFQFLHAIGNLEKFILVKITSEKNTNERSKGIEAELSLPDRIAKRLFSDSSQTHSSYGAMHLDTTNFVQTPN